MIRFVLRRLLWTIPTLFLDHVPRLRRHPRRHRSRGQLPADQPACQPGPDPAVQGGQRAHRHDRLAVLPLAGPLRHRSTGADRSRAAAPCGPTLKHAMANTIVLGGSPRSIGIIVGLGIGILSALRPRSLFDQTSTTAAFVGHLDPAVRHARSCCSSSSPSRHPLARSVQPGAAHLRCLSRRATRASTWSCGSST